MCFIVFYYFYEKKRNTIYCASVDQIKYERKAFLKRYNYFDALELKIILSNNLVRKRQLKYNKEKCSSRAGK